jgi:hypothetical protein
MRGVGGVGGAVGVGGVEVWEQLVRKVRRRAVSVVGRVKVGSV